MYKNSNEDTPRSTTSAADVQERPKRSGQGFRAGLLFFAIFAVLLILGLLPRLKLNPQLQSDAAAAKATAPLVNVTKAIPAPKTTKLDLPGDVEAADQTAISARASGYLSKWYVDIGDHVKAGQVLALIEVPDQDQQVAQARAQYIGSAASSEQAKATYYMQVANADQAVANVSKADAAVEQAKSDLEHSVVGVQQAQQQADQQAATLRAAEASRDLAKLTADRYESLAKQGAIDQQTADQDLSNYKNSQANVESLQQALKASQTNVDAARETVESGKANLKSMIDSKKAAQAAVTAADANVKASVASEGAAVANVSSNKANLDRNAILQGFEKVVAPFDGVITGRNVEVGSLISTTGGVTATTGSDVVATTTTSANSATNSSLFSMVRTNTVRVFVSVPQQFVDTIRPGQQVRISVGNLGKVLTGTVNRDASVLDQTSRTLLTQIDVPNKNGLLRPGMFATVTLIFPQTTGAWRIPDTCLIADASGTRVATVTADNKVHFNDIVVGRDYGKEMDVTSGLDGTETLIANPSASLLEGMTVKKVAPQPATAGAAGAPAAGGPPAPATTK